MRRLAVTATLVLLLAVPASARAASGDAPRLRAAVTSCETGMDPASRAASFTASMPAAADTVRMAISFELQQRTVDGGVWQRVAAPSFGRWERSRTGVAGFVYAKDVHGLSAPGEYRAVVRFRWWAQDGSVRTVRRVTRSCQQPDPRPDLHAGRVAVSSAGTPGLVTYQIPVRNRGRSIAGPFAVAVALDGAEVARASVVGLAPGAVTTVAITAPVCAAGHVLEVRVDPDNAVDESREADDVTRPACPLGA